MGTSLYSIANHQIPFEAKSQREIIDIILPRLNTMPLKNQEFLLDFALEWNHDRPDRLASIRTSTFWLPIVEDSHHYDFNTSEDKDKSMDFEGPYDLDLSFDDSKIWIHNPPYRYRQWFCLQNSDGTDATLHRNEWRKYMRQVAYIFGGNRVIYLADNAHPLDKYISSDYSFEEIEQELKKEFGEPARAFSEVCANEKTTYFIDFFDDLD
ncbi:hypothetical protein [Hymenobacter canadensis]|uniref:Uncharacterized protein n=1 Tax=Hymenobacter canadensis TaxID=2999067 RepID=A0ABY7LSU8_9BACT|nr:hypothetical protein [Hymenobacter canadensis]WBA41805.1 hypothetical protein O3303_18585 [Hymenobacter canadensis]